MYIKVTVTAEDEETASDVTTEPVGVYEELEILTAEQTGQYTADLTFSAPVTANDKLEVTKGGNKVEFKSAIDTDKLGATLTFTDALTTGEYTVTLTPADTTVKPSSVTFEAKRSELSEIRFLNNVLVMKDHYYNEGYAYVKGYDQFGNEKSLSGLNVVSGVGTFKSYDSDTGKITIKDDTVAANQTGAFLTIKEVPVFVQYQSGTTVISANETLTVSTRAYLADMEFGEIKKNSTDAAARLTLDELRSGLYYVEINNAEDQYGNALSADDLQDQVEDKVLFVIPGDTGAFYTTGKFSDLNGKTVLWLDGNATSKPGKMDLSITGAGGATFKKENVEIFDNPFIDVLTVDYPDLYESMTQSKKVNFSAVDQYGDDIDLWDFKPVAGKTTRTENFGDETLYFGDVNGMTGTDTQVKISGGAFFNPVEYDTKAKVFTVTVNVNGMQAKDMAVFTVTTAGTKVATQTVTIGERGGAAKIASSFPSTKKLDPNGTWNINGDIEFVDNNGNVMTRYKNNTLYPYFVDGDVIATSITDDSLKNDQKPSKYVWTVSNKKIEKAADAASATFDSDGKLDPTAGELGVSAGNAADFYATVYGLFSGKYYILDSKTVRVSSIALPAEKVEVVAPGTLYADPKSEHSVSFKVKLTNQVGESWTDDAQSVSVGGIFADTTSGNTVNGNIAKELPGDTTATVPASVYYAGDLVGTTTLTYTNVKPVATSTKFEYEAVAVGNDGTEKGRAGVKFSKAIVGSEFEAGSADTYKIADGVLTITDANSFGDTYTAKVTDQYGVTMKDTTFYLNGNKLTSGNGQTVPGDRNIWEFKNDTQGKAFYMTSDGATVDVEIAGSTSTVSTSAELIKALKAAASSDASDVIEVGEDITLGAAITVGANDELVIPYGLSVTTTKDVINNGTIRGSEAVGSNTALTAGTFKIDGTGLTISPKFTNNGVVDLPGSSLELVDTVVTGLGIIGGHIVIDGDVIFDSNAVQALVAGTQIEMNNAAASLTVAGDLAIVGDVSGSTPATDAKVTLTDSTGSDTDLNAGAVENAMTLSDTGADGKPVTSEGEFLVATPDDFIEVINLADTIILAHDVDLSKSEIAKNIFTQDTAIDLNGFDLEVAKDHSIWVSGATLTLTDSSESNDGDLIGSADQSAITAMNNGLDEAGLVVDPDCLGTNASLGTYFFADQQGSEKPSVTLTSAPGAAVKIKASAFSTVVELNDTEVIATLNADAARAAAPVAVYVGSSALSLTDGNSTWTAGATTANKEYRADLTVTVPASN